MFKYRDGIDVLEMLKAKGYSTYRIRKEKLFGEGVIQKFRTHQLPSWNELDKLCKLLSCGPWDIIEYTQDNQ